MALEQKKWTPIPEGDPSRHLCARCRRVAPGIALSIAFTPQRVGVSPIAWICRTCQVQERECLCCAQPVPGSEVMCAPCQSDYEWALLQLGRSGD